MRKEQKEGVLIVAVSIITLLILALLTDWRFGFSEADFSFSGFERSCEYKPPPNPSGIDRLDDFLRGTCPFGVEYVLAFSLKFKTLLIFFLPILTYGILRALGIIRRLFTFEEKLFKFIEGEEGVISECSRKKQ